MIRMFGHAADHCPSSPCAKNASCALVLRFVLKVPVDFNSLVPILTSLTALPPVIGLIFSIGVTVAKA